MSLKEIEEFDFVKINHDADVPKRLRGLVVIVMAINEKTPDQLQISKLVDIQKKQERAKVYNVFLKDVTLFEKKKREI